MPSPIKLLSQMTERDTLTIYCNQLGMLVEFSYCSKLQEGLPCRNIIGCWKQRMDIIAFLNKTFTYEELKRVFSGLPKSRIERIIESLGS